MCDPVSLTVAATAVAATGTVYAGVRQSQMHAYEAKVAQNNRVYAERAARDAEDRGRREQVEQGRRIAALRGLQTAQMAAGGVDVAFGSPLDIANDTDLQGLTDQQAIRENANREAMGLFIDAQNYREQSRMSKLAAKNTMIATTFEAGSTLLSGASQTAAAARKYRRPPAAGGR